MSFISEEGTEIDYQEENWLRTSLHLAAKNGHLSTVKMLVSFGADITHKDKLDKTAARLAAENGHFDVVDYLKSQ